MVRINETKIKFITGFLLLSLAISVGWLSACIIGDWEGTGTEVNYNLSKINEEVIFVTQDYFEDIDFVEFNISYINSSWSDSYYSFGEETMVIGLNDIKDDPDKYKLVFTHEYIHYILNEYELENISLHEGLADVYTAFLNKEAQAEIFGSKNEQRGGSYAMFTNKILEEDNFDCLSKVFNKEDKINSVDEILTRLNLECGV